MAQERIPHPRDVVDWSGRRYRVGEDPRELIGWPRWSVLAQAWVAMAAVGVLQYGYGAAVPALMARNGWTLVEAFWPLAGWVVFQAAVGFPAAYLRERGRIGPRGLALVGAGCCELGLLALAYSPDLAVVLLGYSVVGGTGAGLVYAACTSTVAKWYPERSAVRVGSVTGAFAYGSAPVAAGAVLGMGPQDLRPALLVAAAVLFLLVAAAGLNFVDPPARWWPAHVDPREWALGGRGAARRRTPPAVRELSVPEALRTRALVVMALILVCAGAVSLFDAAFLVVLAAPLGAGAAVVALAAALVTGLNGATRALAVGAAERIGCGRALGVVLAVQALGQLLLAAAVHTAAPALLLVAAAVAGLGGGAFYPLFAALAREYFGEDRALEVHGVVYSAKAGSGVLGVGLAAGAVVAWGPGTTFLVAAAVAVASAWATTALRRPGLPRTLPGVRAHRAPVPS
jgi:MFS family permease